VADVVAVVRCSDGVRCGEVLNAIHAEALSTDLPLGKEVFGDGTTPYRLAQYLAYPSYILLVAGCLWSAWQMRGRPELRDRFVGTLLIAVGATIVAIGSGVGAGLDVVPIFSIGLLAGIAVMYWGSCEHRARPRRSEEVQVQLAACHTGSSGVAGTDPAGSTVIRMRSYALGSNSRRTTVKPGSGRNSPASVGAVPEINHTR
jgi:hypothetical protein